MGIGFLAFIMSIGVYPAKASNWLLQEKEVAVIKLLANINPAGTKPGTVIASPQRAQPNYYYHWVRDAALSMQAVFDLLTEAKDSDTRAMYESLIKNYVALSVEQQKSSTLAGLGEPKFEPDGLPFVGPWGRPQNDGPALRALTLIHYALWKIEHHQAIADLYVPEMSTNSPIKADLEYVSHHWQEPSFDLWEEVLGDHFYTRMVQRRALIEGAQLARLLGDVGAADFYQNQAGQLKNELEKHWDANRQLIIPTLNRRGGLDGKTSDLDVAVILGALHGDVGDGFFAPLDVRVRATAAQLVGRFKSLYSINNESLGVAIGRYPEDVYSGSDLSGGNPWVLATLALAEFNYRQAAIDSGDLFIERVHKHAFPDGSLSEQIGRDTGFMTSAADLTWNYAAVLSVVRARAKKK